MTIEECQKVLGLNKNATADDIKRAYKTLAKKYHPDLNPNDRNAEEKMKELNVAYDTLLKAGNVKPIPEPPPKTSSTIYDIWEILFPNTSKKTDDNKNIVLEPCPDCDGTGEQYIKRNLPFGTVCESIICKRCQGKGKIIKNPS